MVTVLLLVGINVSAQEQKNLAQLEELVIEARQQGRLDDAENLAYELLTQASSLDNQTVQADALYQQARISMERNLYPEAQTLLNQSIQMYQDQGDELSLGEAYRQLGLTYRYQSNYPTALEYIYLSMQIFQQGDDQKSIAAAYNSIGVVMEKMGQYEEAAQAHQLALEIEYEIGDSEGLASALYNLGDIRRDMGDHELAFKYFQDALKLDIETGNKKNIAYSNLKIGDALIAIGDYQQARTHLNEALTLFREIETPRDTDWAITNLARLEMQIGNLTLAQSLIEGVIERATKNQYNSLLVEAYQVASELAIKQQDFNKALNYVEAGLNQAKENGELAEQSSFEALRVQVHMATDSLKQAIQALQRQKQLDDIIINEKRLDSIARVQAQTEFVRRAHQIELLEKEKALQAAKSKQQALSRQFWLITVIACSFLVILLYARMLQNKINRRLENQVAQRTRELEIKNQQLAQAYRDMETISMTDKLTGIHNRRFLEQHIDADLEQCNRVYLDWLNGKSTKPHQADLAVFICDMDNFKQVNDKYGHNAGDRVLKQFAERMAKVFRHSDYLVRWGGEEFVAVARFIERDDADTLAMRMQEIINTQPFVLNDTQSAFQTCSIGFACFPLLPGKKEQSNWQTLIALADACLYKVKTSGKNSWMGIKEVTEEALCAEEISQNRLTNLLNSGKLIASMPEHPAPGPLRKVGS